MRDSKNIVLFVACGFIAVCLFIGLVFFIDQSEKNEVKKKQQLGCNYYRDWAIEDIPAKCLKYFEDYDAKWET